MDSKKHDKKLNERMIKDLAEIDREAGKCVAPPGQGVDFRPTEETDDFTRKLMEDERAFLNPEEWGIDLGAIVHKAFAPPTDPDELDTHQLHGYLRCLIDILARFHVCLTNTNHFTDGELYRHIMTEVLPKPLGIGPNPSGGILYHECCSYDDDDYLMYYADEELRQEWADSFDTPLPEKRTPASDRDSWIELLAEAYRFDPLPQENEV